MNHDAFKLNLQLKKKSFVISRSCNLSIKFYHLQEAKAAVEETRALRSRIHLAEAAQRQARGMEMDYEEVIRLLEAEIVELKAQLSDHCGQNKVSKAVSCHSYHGFLAVVMYLVFIFFSSA